jgi:hypothetical protein
LPAGKHQTLSLFLPCRLAHGETEFIKHFQSSYVRPAASKDRSRHTMLMAIVVAGTDHFELEISSEPQADLASYALVAAVT